MKKVKLVTLGCRVNLYESEAMAGLFLKHGYDVVQGDEEADIYVINTCAVTNEAGRKSRQTMRHIKKEHPQSIIVFTGCYAQMEEGELKEKLPEADIILGNADKDKVVSVLQAYTGNKGETRMQNMRQVHEFDHLRLGNFHGHTRAFLKIEDGCNNFCSYCIIPYVRGPVRSKDLTAAVKEAEELAQKGYREIVLTGIHLGQYGKDGKPYHLLTLLEKLQELKGIERIRLSSIEGMELDSELLYRMKDMDKICHHFHIPLQSGSDNTLKSMNRRYDTKEYREKILTVRELFQDVSISTDVIVGFPGETEEDFLESVAFCKEMEFSKIHVFPYSKRSGTKASEMKCQLTQKIKSERSQILVAISDTLAYNFYIKFVNRVFPVLFEQWKKQDGFYISEGYTDHYIRVRVNSDRPLENIILPVRLTDALPDGMEGELV